MDFFLSHFPSRSRRARAALPGDPCPEAERARGASWVPGSSAERADGQAWQGLSTSCFGICPALTSRLEKKHPGSKTTLELSRAGPGRLHLARCPPAGSGTTTRARASATRNRRASSGTSTRRARSSTLRTRTSSTFTCPRSATAELSGVYLRVFPTASGCSGC